MTGPVSVVLYIATSANDTDFTAKLVDVQPDGRPLLVTDGIQRLRYRLSLNHPAFAKRNTAYQINIDAGVTSFVFATGHRIRLEISSSNFPRFDRNLNSLAPECRRNKIHNRTADASFTRKAMPRPIILPSFRLMERANTARDARAGLRSARVPPRIESSWQSNVTSDRSIMAAR